ncbi:MAG TPA: hypothetical protein VKR06_38260 [Ktedonosporobacter sp.]|nr:hypothetical protein [Ktedonosporobacter sp.]
MTYQRPTSWQPYMPLPAHPPSIQSLIMGIDPVALAIQCEYIPPLSIVAIQVGYAMSEAVACRVLAGLNVLKGTHYTVDDVDQSSIVRGSCLPQQRRIGRWRPEE